MEDGAVSHPEAGTPQGGVISPLLATSTCTKCWTRGSSRTVKPRLEGRAFLVRYADDAVLVFEAKRTRGGCWTCCRSDSASTA